MNAHADGARREANVEGLSGGDVFGVANNLSLFVAYEGKAPFKDTLWIEEASLVFEVVQLPGALRDWAAHRQRKALSVALELIAAAAHETVQALRRNTLRPMVKGQAFSLETQMHLMFEATTGAFQSGLSVV